MYKLERWMTRVLSPVFQLCKLSQVRSVEIFSLPAVTALLENLGTHLSGCGGGRGSWGRLAKASVLQSLSLKSAKALVAAAVSVLIPLTLRCQLPRGSGIKPGPVKASQR